MAKVRCNKSMLENRLNTITTLLAENRTSGDIVKYCQDNYQVTEKTARMYMQVARAEVMEFLQKDKNEIMSDFLLQYRALYQTALVKGELSTAFKVLEKIQSLFGITTLRDIDGEVKSEEKSWKYAVTPIIKPAK